MHFYRHNIADFNDATLHCSRLERSIYREAIDLYYKTERPLNGCSNRLHRLLRINSEEEKEALEFVLEEFFTKTDEGYENRRCEEEITEYKESKNASAIAGQVSGLSREIKGLVAKAKRKIGDAKTKDQKVKIVTDLQTDYEQALNGRSNDVRNMFEQKANKHEPTKELIKLLNYYTNNKDLGGSDEPQEKPKNTVRKPKDDLSYRQIPNLNIEAWEAWLENRKLRKLPKYKTNQCAISLAEFTHKEQADAVAKSIKQEYTGVFPKKASQSSNPVDRRQQVIDDFVNGGSVISEQ